MTSPPKDDSKDYFLGQIDVWPKKNIKVDFEVERNKTKANKQTNV